MSYEKDFHHDPQAQSDYAEKTLPNFDLARNIANEIIDGLGNDNLEYGAVWKRHGGAGAWFHTLHSIEVLSAVIKKAHHNAFDVTDDLVDRKLDEVIGKLILLREARESMRVDIRLSKLETQTLEAAKLGIPPPSAKTWLIAAGIDYDEVIKEMAAENKAPTSSALQQLLDAKNAANKNGLTFRSVAPAPFDVSLVKEPTEEIAKWPTDAGRTIDIHGYKITEAKIPGRVTVGDVKEGVGLPTFVDLQSPDPAQTSKIVDMINNGDAILTPSANGAAMSIVAAPSKAPELTGVDRQAALDLMHAKPTVVVNNEKMVGPDTNSGMVIAGYDDPNAVDKILRAQAVAVATKMQTEVRGRLVNGKFVADDTGQQ